MHKTDNSVLKHAFQEISPSSPHNNRIRTVRELCEVVQTRILEENAVEVLWINIQDLLQPSVSKEDRHLALTFLACLIRGQVTCTFTTWPIFS